jgi:hypothetical protein
MMQIEACAGRSSLCSRDECPQVMSSEPSPSASPPAQLRLGSDSQASASYTARPFPLALGSLQLSSPTLDWAQSRGPVAYHELSTGTLPFCQHHDGQLHPRPPMSFTWPPEWHHTRDLPRPSMGSSTIPSDWGSLRLDEPLLSERSSSVSLRRNSSVGVMASCTRALSGDLAPADSIRSQGGSTLNFTPGAQAMTVVNLEPGSAFMAPFTAQPPPPSEGPPLLPALTRDPSTPSLLRLSSVGQEVEPLVRRDASKTLRHVASHGSHSGRHLFADQLATVQEGRSSEEERETPQGEGRETRLVEQQRVMSQSDASNAGERLAHFQPTIGPSQTRTFTPDRSVVVGFPVRNILLSLSSLTFYIWIFCGSYLC